jgi:hypothetical protein
VWIFMVEMVAFLATKVNSRRTTRGRLTGALPSLPVALLTELDAFYTENQRCGYLDAGLDGPVACFACGCGASIARRVEEDHYARSTSA